MNRYKTINFFHCLLQNTIYDPNHLQKKGRRKRICMRPNINVPEKLLGVHENLSNRFYIENSPIPQQSPILATVMYPYELILFF